MDFSNLLNLSVELQAFVNEAPYARGPHVSFLRKFACELPADTTLLDVGAGNSPYRELFSHVRYLTSDWGNSLYRPILPHDIVAPASLIPVVDQSFDAILCTQVLEHVPEPLAVAKELYRIVKIHGRVCITVPLVWYLHEVPYDYYRYTSHGLLYLFEQAGFTNITVTPMNDSFSTLAQLVGHLGWIMGRNEDGYDPEREVVAKAMEKIAALIETFSNYDTQWILPLNFCLIGTRPS